MPNDESLEIRVEQKTETISSDADDWGAQFVKHLELEYTTLASQLSRAATEADFRRAMMKAIQEVFILSGAPAEDIARLMEDASANLLPSQDDLAWTSDDNARRMTLIDKWLQRSITPAESIELRQLTARMRWNCDREEMTPLEGARRLHQRLTSGQSEGSPT